MKQSSPSPAARRFWQFPDGAPVRIITNPMWPSVESPVPYSDAWHPNHIQALHDADVDATTHLYAQIRAENPATDVQFLTADRVDEDGDDLTAHIVVLGGIDHLPAPRRPRHPAAEDVPSVLGALVAEHRLPLEVLRPADGDIEYDMALVVTTDTEGIPAFFSAEDRTPHGEEVYAPHFRRDGTRRATAHGRPVLERDTAVLLRTANARNRATTVTLCAGVFSRGTLGAVLSLVDRGLRDRNEQFLRSRITDPDHFWMIFDVPVADGQHGRVTQVPDFTRPGTVRRTSDEIRRPVARAGVLV